METVLAAVCWIYAFRYCGDVTRLSWQHADPKSVSEFLVYRSTDPAICQSPAPIPGEPIARVTGTTYRDRVKADSACYEIAAVGKEGAVSARSERQVWLAKGGSHE